MRYTLRQRLRGSSCLVGLSCNDMDAAGETVARLEEAVRRLMLSLSQVEPCISNYLKEVARVPDALRMGEAALLELDAWKEKPWREDG